jgi:radical S-adenosyl methionine domain-containing protein 2
MKKINFSGGEPFLYKEYLGELVKFCHEDLNIDSITIVSNGSLITEKWIKNYSSHIDILAISHDSFNIKSNKQIGRHSKSDSRDHLETFEENNNIQGNIT